MRFERESDIPQFQGKTRKQRHLLREEARQKDRSIGKLEFLDIVLMMFFMPIASAIADRLRFHAPFSSFLLFAVLAVPFGLGFRGFFIVPRIRQALQANAQPKI